MKLNQIILVLLLLILMAGAGAKAFSFLRTSETREYPAFCYVDEDPFKSGLCSKGTRWWDA